MHVRSPFGPGALYVTFTKLEMHIAHSTFYVILYSFFHEKQVSKREKCETCVRGLGPSYYSRMVSLYANMFSLQHFRLELACACLKGRNFIFLKA